MVTERKLISKKFINESFKKQYPDLTNRQLKKVSLRFRNRLLAKKVKERKDALF